MKTFTKGDRVCSVVMGFYSGVPGTIVEASKVQYSMDKEYIVELDIGKRIVLAASRLELLKK